MRGRRARGVLLLPRRPRGALQPHHRCAPCACPEPGCAFVGSRATLLGHFAAGHQRPVVTVRYGRAWNLSFSLAHRWHALVGDEDRSLFLLSLGPLGAASAVSLLCVRPDGEAAAAPRFRCKLSVERQAGDDKDNLVLMASAVSSSALSTGAPAPGQGMFLAVPQELLFGDTLMLSVQIDLIRPAAAGAVEAEEPYVGLGDEEPLGVEGDAEAVAVSEEVMGFSAALNLGHFLSVR